MDRRIPYSKTTQKSKSGRTLVTHMSVDFTKTVFYDYSYVNKWTAFLTGETNPIWRDQVEMGLNATTHLDAWDITRTFANWECRTYWTYYDPDPNPLWTREVVSKGSTASDYYLNDPAALSESKADNEAKAAHVRRLRKTQRTFQGATVLFEATQLLRLFRNPLRAAREGVGHFVTQAKRRGRGLSSTPLRRKRELLADQWLELQFGLRPLMNDVDDAMKALADHHHRQPRKWETVLSTGTHAELIHRINDYKFTGSTGPYLNCNRLVHTVVNVIYESQVDVGTYTASLDRLGFSQSDIPNAVWEIVPWSFLIDYFTNAGDIISALSLNTSSIRWSRRSVIKEYRTSYQSVVPLTSQTPSDVGFPTTTGGPRRIPPFRSKHVYRDPYNGSFVPSLEFSIPGFGTKWLNLAALYAGRRSLRNIYLTD